MNEAEISVITVIFISVFVVCMLAGCLTMFPGFILLALGKERIGWKLIRFGAGCGAIGFSSVLVAQGGYWPIVVLAVAFFWIILERKRKSKTSACPRCNEQITWEEKWKLSKLFGLRKSTPCSHCGTKIVWSKWPLILMNIGSCLCLIVILFKFLKVQLGSFLDVTIYIALLPMIIGYFTMKLEISD